MVKQDLFRFVYEQDFERHIKYRWLDAIERANTIQELLALVIEISTDIIEEKTESLRDQVGHEEELKGDIAQQHEEIDALNTEITTLTNEKEELRNEIKQLKNEDLRKKLREIEQELLLAQTNASDERREVIIHKAKIEELESRYETRLAEKLHF